MFLITRPSAAAIDRFLHESQDRPLSYGPIGIVSGGAPGYDLDQATVAVGRGRSAFERARAALIAWRQFDVGWVEVFPHRASVAPGTVVAVLIRHLGLWSLNGSRVLYQVGGLDDEDHFGFAYGTLVNHAEAGEELFEVFIDPETDEVVYRIRAASRPRAVLARLGRPVARALQARFRRDSTAAMVRAGRLA
jgi:uncharacterized protein (UPF0548 family)